MIQLVRTDASHEDFKLLVKQLDAYLAIKDGEEHSFYSQFNKIEALKYVVIAYENDMPLGCGAMKFYQPGVMEIKRMFVEPFHRGKGVATQILLTLEDWASELSVTRCVLETGKRQEEAIKLYEKNGYQIIPNYGQYINVENSVCFEKDIH